MTVLNEAPSVGALGVQAGNAKGLAASKPKSPGTYQPRQNVGDAERKVSVAAGAALAVLGLSRRSLPGVVTALIGGGLIQRGLSGHCGLYSKLGIDTAESDRQRHSEQTEQKLNERGIHVEQAFLIDKPADELYAFWRRLENLPSIMKHVKSVKKLDERRYEWVVQAPSLAGGSVRWEAEITEDEPGKVIAWRSLPGSQVDNAGQVRFAKALGDRGTEVHVFMQYLPPAGRLGHWIATIFGQAPRRQMREDLRNFKRLMELGEIPTVDGQPTGSCMGLGKLLNK